MTYTLDGLTREELALIYAFLFTSVFNEAQEKLIAAGLQLKVGSIALVSEGN